MSLCGSFPVTRNTGSRAIPAYWNVVLPSGEVVGRHLGGRRYYLKDQLGSVRVVIDEAGEPVERRDYYPFGLRMPGRTATEGTPAKEDFTGHERDAATGLHYAGARYYMAAYGRWNAADPLADKYPSLSPYNYVANNPLRLVDPDGREIKVCHMASSTDGVGNVSEQEQCFTYTAGMEYEGDNQFAAAAVQTLNAMNSVEHGAAVLEDLISSENVFSFKNIASSGGDETLQFVGNDDGGGVIRAAGLLNSDFGSFERLEGTAHELFHGYQHENGGIQGINSEVGAYLYGRGVAATYHGMAPGFQGSVANPQAGAIYERAINSLLFGEKFNFRDYRAAVQTFASGSGVNVNRLYGRSKVYPISRNPLIKQFFPLFR